MLRSLVVTIVDYGSGRALRVPHLGDGRPEYIGIGIPDGCVVNEARHAVHSTCQHST